MILVVGFLIVEGHLKDLTDDTAEEDSLLLSIFWLVTQVREKFTVKQLIDTSFTVFLLLTSSKFLLQPLVGFRLAFDLKFFVVVDFVDVGNNKLECLLWTRDGSEDFLVVFDSESSHKQDNRDWCRSSSTHFDHEHTVSSLLNGQRLAHAVLLREDFCNLCSLCSSLVNLDCDTVRRQVFHRNENALGSVDDEVATRIERVFAFFAKKVRQQCTIFR